MALDPAPVSDDTVIELVLTGLARGRDLDEIRVDLGAWSVERSFFPSEVLLALAADVIEASGASRERPIDSDQIRRRFIPEGLAHNRAQHYKAEYAVRAAAMTRAGVDPALDDNAGRWANNDLWLWSFEALVVYVRAAAQYAEVSVAEICQRVAERH